MGIAPDARPGDPGEVTGGPGTGTSKGRRQPDSQDNPELIDIMHNKESSTDSIERRKQSIREADREVAWVSDR